MYFKCIVSVLPTVDSSLEKQDGGIEAERFTAVERVRGKVKQ